MSKLARSATCPVPQRQDAPISNPFATRWVRPGAMEYVHPPGQTLAQLLKRLERDGNRGQIVGPHGSGKSTLLHQLEVDLERQGRHVMHLELHNGQRRLPIKLSSITFQPARTLLLVDGVEQLGFWSRAALYRFCRQNRCGLVVTSHRPIGLPTLAQTCTSPDLAQRLVDQLQSTSTPRITGEQVEAAFENHAGDLRETFFELYDRWAEAEPA